MRSPLRAAAVTLAWALPVMMLGLPHQTHAGLPEMFPRDINGVLTSTRPAPSFAMVMPACCPVIAGCRSLARELNPGWFALRPTLAQQLERQMPVVPALPHQPTAQDVLGPRSYVLYSKAVSPPMLAKMRKLQRVWVQMDWNSYVWSSLSMPAAFAGIPPIHQALVDLLMLDPPASSSIPSPLFSEAPLKP